MGTSGIENLTLQFYEWEHRGRGWQVFDRPVDLEPPFEPFYYHAAPSSNFVDDGVKSGIMEGLAKLVAKKKEPEPPPEPAVEPVPYDYVPEGPLRIFSVSLPQGHEVDVAESEQLLLMLSGCKGLISFEIIATSNVITIQFACREPDDLHLTSQLKAYFPEAIIQEKDSIRSILSDDAHNFIIDLGLKEEFMRPLQTAKRFALDPLTGLFGSMEHLQIGEQSVVQILFKGAVDPWPASIMTSVTDSEGDSFFFDAPEMPKMAQEKISSPLFGVVIRCIGQSTNREQARGIAENLGRTIAHTSQSGGNSLITLSNRDYPNDEHAQDVILRQSHRLGMLLNLEELVNLVHIPSVSVVSSKLERDSKKTKIAPAITQGHDLVLGMNTHQGQSRAVSVSSDQRLRHTHIIGATGTGKSTLLQQLIMQDINQGKGIAVLDPHGDLIESVLAGIPGKRISDVVLVDPSDAGGELNIGNVVRPISKNKFGHGVLVHIVGEKHNASDNEKEGDENHRGMGLILNKEKYLKRQIQDFCKNL